MKTVDFTAAAPGEVLYTMYDEVQAMCNGLAESEQAYADDVAKVRDAVNGVPSTFLELYDLTENNPSKV